MEETSEKRSLAARLIIGGLFGLAALSQAKLQTIERDNTMYLGKKTQRYEVTQLDPASRGSILASDGRVLAKDERVYDLTVNPERCPNADGFWLDLSEASGIPASDLSVVPEGKYKARTWPQAVGEIQRAKIEAVRERWHTAAVSVLPAGYREYPLEDDAACLIGVIRRRAFTVDTRDPRYQLAVRENGQPAPGKPATADLLTGLERGQDEILRGTDGERVGLADRQGHLLPMRTQTLLQSRQDGKDLTLTLDSGLQALATASVKKAVEDSKAESGVAVIEDPSNGNLMAVANWPSFSPYNPDGSYAVMGEHGGLNQAYMTDLEPGSMFKILTLAKALDEHVVSMDSTFYCPGEKEVVPGAKKIKCDLHAGNRAHGQIDPVMAIARSCNIWAATWAYEIGYDKFVPYIESLGLLDRPGLGMPGEVRALFNRKDPARKLQVANLGFGQSINCTPVALAGAFSTLANGGVHLHPRLVEKIGNVEQPVATGKRLLSEQSCKDVIKGMIAVMENPHGTGYTLRIPGYEIAGKTGTAQKVGSKTHGHVSNFVGFVPAQHPRAVILVMVNNPKNKYYGAEVAGPVFKSLASEIIRKYRIPPTTASGSEPAPPAGSYHQMRGK
jgi:cell division protein FtsI (penicillin-binding protein 3)